MREFIVKLKIRTFGETMGVTLESVIERISAAFKDIPGAGIVGEIEITAPRAKKSKEPGISGVSVREDGRGE